MAEGWTPITSGSGGGGTIVPADDCGAAGFFEPSRASVNANAFATFEFGGSRIQSAILTGYRDAPAWVDWELPHARYAGYTWELLAEILCADAGTSGRVRVRNITDGSTEAEGPISTATTWTKQAALAFTPIVLKVYRLQVLKGNDSANVWVVGQIRRTI